MRNRTIWIVIAAILIVLFAAYFIMKEEVQAPVMTASGGPASITTIATSSQTRATSAGQSVNVYLVDISTEGVPGTKNAIGCGDILAVVKEEITPTQSVLIASLKKLFSLKDQNAKIGAATYYNALYQSNLKVDSATVLNGVATVKISGTTQLGGECDGPRAIAQIRQTVLQFPTITQANIFINNKKLEDYFSLK